MVGTCAVRGRHVRGNCRYIEVAAALRASPASPLLSTSLHIASLLAANDFAMPVLDISQCSGANIPKYVYDLPAHLESQPPLVKDWCTPCIPQFAQPQGFRVDKLRSIALRHSCKKEHEYDTCSNCVDNHVSCTRVGILLRLWWHSIMGDPLTYRTG
jgi:hypothetical protein